MELSELIKIKQIKEVRCLVDVFMKEPLGPGNLIVSVHVLCYDSDTTRFQVLHTMIQSVVQENSRCTVYCKDFRTITFLIEQKEECDLLVETLNLLSNIQDTELTLPFFVKPKSKEEIYEGYDEVLELKWLEFPPTGWKISRANSKYQITECYSEVLVIPTGWEDVMLRLAECRIENRVPRPTFLFHHPKKGKCMLITAGDLKEANTLQYKISDKEYKDLDILYMKHVLDSSGNAVLFTEAHFRDKLIKREYDGWDHVKLHVPLGDMKHAISDMRKKEMWSAGNKKWLDMVWFLLRTTDTIINKMQTDGCSVLLELYPRILSSLTQLCLESRYRTTFGLITCLLRKEWLHSGYPFQSRSTDGSCTEFLLFLHATRQLLLWFPTAFQYSEDLLIAIHANANASRYGDFLRDSPAQRVALNIPGRTQSFLETVLQNQPVEYSNPAYKPVEGVIRPRVGAPESVQGWGRLFLRNVALDKEEDKLKERRRRLYVS